MDGGDKYICRKLEEEEVGYLACGSQAFYWTILGLRYHLDHRFNTSAGTWCVSEVRKGS